jgi:23S rRNA pseudouridine1911/1915/1917 synthase
MNNTDTQSNTPDKTQYPDKIEHRYELLVAKGQIAQRLDHYLTQMIANATRTKVQRAINAGNVLVNGAVMYKASRKIQPGDIIVCTVMKPPPMELIPENIPLDIVYEDDDVLVVNKRAGMVVHPGFGNRYGTLVNAVLWHLGEREARVINLEDDENEDAENEEVEPQTNEDDVFKSAEIRPGIVHRLDMDTSGLMVISKNPDYHAVLAKQFADRVVEREYRALAWGRVDGDEGMIEGNLARSTRDRKLFQVVQKGGKYALTEYHVVERFTHCTLLRLKLHTGRTHQIRVHCAWRKHTLFGDPQYGGDAILYGGHNVQFRVVAQKLLSDFTRQALHAKTLGFYHPRTRVKMQFDSELPEDMKKILAEIRAIEV